jgi:amino acid transporter
MLDSAALPTASPPAPGRLRRELSSLGVLLLTLSALSPVISVFGAGSDVLQHAGSGAALLFLAAIGVAVVWAAVYAELASAYPYAGGDYVAVGSILGSWAGFASLTVWAVTAAPLNAFTAETAAMYLAQVVPSVSPAAWTFVSMAVALVFALLSVRSSAIVTGAFIATELVSVLALIAAGLSHPVRGLAGVLAHPQMLAPSGAALIPAALGVMAVAGVNAAYATTGGNQAIAFGEELRDPHRKMGRVVMIAGMIGAFTIALPVVFVVLAAPDLAETIRSPAPFTSFFEAIAGPRAGTALNIGVALAAFNALIVQLMFYGRLFFSLGRDEIFPPLANRWLTRVDAATGVPRAATLFIGVISAACCLLSSHVLIIFGAGLTTFTLSLVSAAALFGRRKGLTGLDGHWRTPLFPLFPLLGLGVSAGFLVASLSDEDAGRPSVLLLGGSIAIALLWYRFVLRRRLGNWRPRIGSMEGGER